MSEVAGTARQTLRPYQERALAEAREAYRAGKTAAVLVLPTGGGKTTIGSRLAVGAEEKGNPVVWLAHREELLDQARDRLLREGVRRAGIVAGGRPTMNAPVQVASLDTLVSRAAHGLPPAKVVIFDECHHGRAKTYLEIVKHYRAQGAAILGLTATPERGDGQGLGGDLFDVLIPVSSVRELQTLGVLCQVITYRPAKPLQSLSMDPVAAYLARTPGERAFVFAKDVAHAESMTLAFRAQNVPAACIHGKTRADLRKALLEAFRTQERGALVRASSFDAPPLVLVNAYVLTEGVDVPEASHAILARGCGHKGMMLQMVGRVLRAAPNKDRAVFSDLRGVTHKLGIPEADQQWSLDGVACRLDAKERERKPIDCPACDGVITAWATDRDGWRICPLCRERIAAPSPVEIKPTLQHVAGRLAPAEDRARAMARWARVCAGRGYKETWISVQHKKTFGEWPPWGSTRTALALAIEDQGHPPPEREPKAAGGALDCPWCGLRYALCTCDVG